MPDNTRRDALYTVVYLPGYKKQASFRGWAKSVSSTNSEGSFDVLPLHENFVTTIKNKVTIVDLEGKNFELNLEKGLLEASENVVKVFVEF